MPIGLGFQRKHRRLGYRIKYLYYCLARRDVLQKKVSYGNQNQDKTVYVIKPDYQDGVEGLLSLITKQVLYIDYARKKGYIPYVDWKNYHTQYRDGSHNAWEFFFKQPSKIREKEVYNSKNVILSGWTYHNIDTFGFMSEKIFFDPEARKRSSKLLKSNLIFSDKVNTLVREEAEQVDIENCMGLYIRGTDYVRLRPSGEYVQPDIDQVIQKTDEFIQKYDAPIFLVTEDGDIFDKMRCKYGDRIRLVSYDTFIRNYDGKDVLSKSSVLEDDKEQRGQKYLVKMILLSKCRYLISSITSGSKISYLWNDGKYEDEYIFDLGLYK